MWKSHILHTLSASKCFPCVGRSKPASFNFLFVLISDKQSAYKCPVFPGVNWEGLVYKQLGTWVTNTYTWPLETDSTWQLPKRAFPLALLAAPCHAMPHRATLIGVSITSSTALEMDYLRVICRTSAGMQTCTSFDLVKTKTSTVTRSFLNVCDPVTLIQGRQKQNILAKVTSHFWQQTCSIRSLK